MIDIQKHVAFFKFQVNIFFPQGIPINEQCVLYM